MCKNKESNTPHFTEIGSMQMTIIPVHLSNTFMCEEKLFQLVSYSWVITTKF